ncbi:MAG TPA: methyltransferase domain-containing protein [Sphingomicrobium sp.]|nr:methyltransferase domain-containing protein [Sphingomicrobium sp.]
MGADHFSKRESCPVCASGGSEIFFSAPMAEGAVRSFIESHYCEQGQVDWSYLEGAQFELAHCKACDLIYQVHAPDDRLLTHVYTEMITPDYLRSLEVKDFTVTEFMRTAGELAVLFRMTGKPPLEVSFLDYGFGWGRWGRVARAMGASVFATEIGEDKKALARSLGVTVLDDHEIDGRTFDIVHTEQVLEHLVEPGRDFARLAAATGHVLKVAVPARGRIRELLERGGMPTVSPFYRTQSGGAAHRTDDAYISVQPLEHLNAFSPATMDWLARANRMRVVSRVRNRISALDLTGAGPFAQSAAGIARQTGKMIVRPDMGYYLFRPA